jgi:hypothetical protein
MLGEGSSIRWTRLMCTTTTTTSRSRSSYQVIINERYECYECYECYESKNDDARRVVVVATTTRQLTLQAYHRVIRCTKVVEINRLHAASAGQRTNTR